MRIYVLATGIVFALITVAHIWRMMAENPHLASEPDFIIVTLLSTGLALWAALLLWRVPARKT